MKNTENSDTVETTFWRTVHFRTTDHIKDRPLSPFWTVHFEPYSKNEFILQKITNKSAPIDQDGQFTLQ